MEELPITLRPIILFFLLGINSFFAAAEVALVSVRETRMKELAQGGDHRAQLVLDLLSKPDRMLSATQLGVTLASLGLGWAGEDTVYSMLEPLFQPLATPATEPLVRFFCFALAFALITFLHMVLGEVVPKNLALERAERLALMVAGPMNLFTRMTTFFVSLVEVTVRRILRLLGLKVNGAGKGYTGEELKLVVSGAADERHLRPGGGLYRPQPPFPHPGLRAIARARGGRNLCQGDLGIRAADAALADARPAAAGLSVAVVRARRGVRPRDQVPLRAAEGVSRAALSHRDGRR
jgi:hypothetical protein